jgi:hypothetical protein
VPTPTPKTGSSTGTVPTPTPQTGSQTGSSNGGGSLITYQTVSSNGAVSTSANLAVYSDSACTTSLASLNWGTLTPGRTSTYTIYVKNTSTGLSLSLSMTTSSWSPASANGPITIAWNQQGIDLQPGASVAAVLTLTVSSSIVDVTSFRVNINISGTSP